MNMLTKTTILAAVGAAMIAGAATARDNRDVVHDNQGHVVQNTFSNCVRTKWVNDHDECAAIEQAAAVNVDLEARTVYFDFDSAVLTPAGRAKLDSLAASISGRVESVSVYGYADMIGTSQYNRRLSAKRAEAVRSYIANKGIPTAGADVRALGEDTPNTDCKGLPRNEQIRCLWRDRRVEVELNVAN